MARKLNSFPGAGAPSPQKYPWAEWTDGSVWEIRSGEDYDVATENMRVNLHMKAETLSCRVKTQKIRDDEGEGLVFQFVDSDETRRMKMLAVQDPEGTQRALDQLYADLTAIYERARAEVTIPRKDGTTQKYAANRFKQQIDKGYEENALIPTVARIVRKQTTGFGHLAEAGRPDLMVETLVVNEEAPYHRFFTPKTIDDASRRLIEYDTRG
jgi:hypothetical protein